MHNSFLHTNCIRHAYFGRWSFIFVFVSNAEIFLFLPFFSSGFLQPDDPDEMARITAWGGFVCPPAEAGLSARVYLDPGFTMIGLAMARSIGEYFLWS